ncbi:MAG: hypothetical protein L0H31_13190 [Nocardioidaceae bacterium]|nr:hypothetical protein [Nocardioidaceae bacterium]
MSSHGLAWGWATALRGGSTMSWRDWLTRGEHAEPFATHLPGAQQLALLRRLNLTGSVSAVTASRVLAASVSGRGRGELGLQGDDDNARFGPLPVDPDDLDADELLRVAAPLIADDVAASARPEPERTLLERARHRHRPWEPSFRIVGVPWRAQVAETGVIRQGRRPGGRRPTAYLLADDLAGVLAHAWTARAFDQGGPTWSEFLAISATGGQLPPRADLARMARAASARYGKGQVVIVLDSAALARTLGLESFPDPPVLGAHAIDLVRRVGSPLGMLVDPAERPRILQQRLMPRLAGAGGALPTVPDRWQPWLSTHAERTRHDLEAGGYPVLGNLDRLLPEPAGGEPVLPDAAQVLRLAVGLLLDPVSERETT